MRPYPARNSTTKSKIFTAFRIAVAIAFWLAVWHVASAVIDNDFLLPSVSSTGRELLSIITSPASYKIMLFTLARVSMGLILGIIFGAGLGILCHRFKILKAIISPMISVIKSTPVASFIILLWIMMSGNTLSVVVAVLMVTPITYQNVFSAYSSIDKNLAELCDVFNFSEKKRFRFLVLPALLSYLVPAVVTSAGLAWKAEIAAEIIAYTKNSIGQNINDAKFYMETPRVFAWTVIVIVFSIALEFLTKLATRRMKNVN